MIDKILYIFRIRSYHIFTELDEGWKKCVRFLYSWDWDLFQIIKTLHNIISVWLQITQVTIGTVLISVLKRVNSPSLLLLSKDAAREITSIRFFSRISSLSSSHISLDAGGAEQSPHGLLLVGPLVCVLLSIIWCSSPPNVRLSVRSFAIRVIILCPAASFSVVSVDIWLCNGSVEFFFRKRESRAGHPFSALDDTVQAVIVLCCAGDSLWDNWVHFKSV